MSLSDWLWTAPEILRSESGKKAGSPQADVYSFSIIVSEVLTHDEPFAMFQMEPRGHFQIIFIAILMTKRFCIG
jgi:serine/threonine protein kinase